MKLIINKKKDKCESNIEFENFDKCEEEELEEEGSEGEGEKVLKGANNSG